MSRPSLSVRIVDQMGRRRPPLIGKHGRRERGLNRPGLAIPARFLCHEHDFEDVVSVFGRDDRANFFMIFCNRARISDRSAVASGPGAGSVMTLGVA